MWRRFLLYGALGWAIEVAFTGAHSLLFGRDRSGTARSYLWMHPIYGLGGLALEGISKHLGHRSRLTRAALGTASIYALEYGSGHALRALLGRCPWDYGRNGFNVHGLVRLDYVPFWMGLAFLFEPLAAAIFRPLEKAVVDAASSAVSHAPPLVAAALGFAGAAASGKDEAAA